jgi:SAM-dependent methyltransferase
MGRNCDPRRRDARPLRGEHESRSSLCTASGDVRWPINDRSIDKGRKCLDQARVQAALMLRQLAFAMRISRALYAAAQLGIADLLAGGPMTSERLALAAGADAQSLRRLLRALVAYGVFEEDAPDRYCLNAAAELLRRDVPGSQRAAVLFTAGDMTWQLWADVLESVRTGHAVVERAFGKNIFERHAQNGEESALFGQAMAAFSAALSLPLITAYDFSSFSCIADVGGGTGRLLADILAANPEVRGILFDLPDVSTAAPPLLEASGVAGRCKLVVGNFFEGVPAGADAYLLKHVLHDWDDARAITIISNCRKAMAPSATLLIVERVLPERAEEGRAAEAYLVDLEMLVQAPGGRERTESEFQAILSAAGFAMTRIVPTTTPVIVIEARPA